MFLVATLITTQVSVMFICYFETVCHKCWSNVHLWDWI